MNENKYINTSIKSLGTIPTDIDFIGYYWMSDADKPVLVDGKISEHKNPDEKYSISNPFSTLSQNPYIVEANLYCEADKLSISIKNTGEGAIVTAIRIPEEIKGGIEFTKQSYIAHRLTGVGKVCFKQAWEAIDDPNCGGMKVLKPTWRAFKKFDYETKNKED